MERVSGIGGLFFRAQDPAAIGRWYEEHLGILKGIRSNCGSRTADASSSGEGAVRAQHGDERGRGYLVISAAIAHRAPAPAMCATIEPRERSDHDALPGMQRCDARADGRGCPRHEDRRLRMSYLPRLLVRAVRNSAPHARSDTEALPGDCRSGQRSRTGISNGLLLPGMRGAPPVDA
jgi:hypothetical protein